MSYKPNADQLAAVRRYAVLHGRHWRSCLWIDWERAMEGTLSSFDDSCLLQQIRNQCSPSWLIRFRL